MNIDPESSMRVVMVKLDMFFPYTHSLKEKRDALRKIKDKVFGEFKISVHEVSHHDKWQRTTLGFAVVGNDAGLLQAVTDKVSKKIENLDLGEIIDSLVEVNSF